MALLILFIENHCDLVNVDFWMTHHLYNRPLPPLSPPCLFPFEYNPSQPCRSYLIVWANLPVAWQRGHTCFMRTGQVTSPLSCFNRWLLNNWLDLSNSVRPFLLAFPLQIHITQTLSSSFFPVNTFVNRCKTFYFIKS